MCKNHVEKVVRTYGIELEGYTDENIRGNWVRGWNLTDDGSLTDGMEECDYCDGSGERECSECWGSGSHECGDCAGSGEVPCEDCDCTGEIECDNCDGYGTLDDGEEECDCPKCDGSGKLDCNTCDTNGYVSCETCDGKGQYDCDTCDGDGHYECGDCDGRGSFGDDSDGYGVECVSGINTEGDYESIDRIFDYINGYSWSTNDDCGTHVHIGADDLQATDLSKLAILGNIVEPFIYGISPSERIEGTYAKMVKRDMVEYFIAKGDEITFQEVADNYYGYSVRLNGSFQKYDGARYYGINLHSYFYRRNKSDGATVEFRYFEGCDSREQAKAWIDLCIKLVDFAKHTTFEQLKVIGLDFSSVDNIQDYIVRVKELLGLEYNFTSYSNYGFTHSKRNIASQLRTTHIITRAV
jgi:hypothetical protein